MPKVLQYYNDAKLIIAGKGGMIDELRSQVNSLGLGNKVYFTGIGYDFYIWQLDSDFIPLFFSPQICYMLIFLLNFCY